MEKRDEIDAILNQLDQTGSVPAEKSAGTPQRRLSRTQAPPPKKKRWRAPFIVRFLYTIAAVAIIIGISFALAVFLVDSGYDLMGLNQEDEQIMLEVKAGDTLDDIVDQLEAAGVIKSPFVFKLFAKFRHADENPLVARDHTLNKNMSYDMILDDLVSDISEEASTVEITFREGLTLDEIAAMLEENGVCKAVAFKEALETEDFAMELEDTIPESNLRFTRFEGYIFPDTYTFYVGEKPKSVANRFLTNFVSRINSELFSKMEEMGMTLDETITLASMIQAEVGGGPEMTHVSSVFHNRLNNPEAGLTQLQSDVTVLYVNEHIAPHLSADNQAMYDAYNTYVCEGIPVGPICNPGLDAIKAALYPDATYDYYFLTDNAGTFYYAQNFEGHSYNLALAEQVNNQLAEQSSSQPESSNP